MRRRIVNLDGSDIEVMYPTKEWMRRKYQEFKEKYFSKWAMPDSVIMAPLPHPIEGSWGVERFKCKGLTDGMRIHSYDFSPYRIPEKYIDGVSRHAGSWCFDRKRDTMGGEPRFSIILSTHIMLPEKCLEDTMMHEMIHVCNQYNGMWDGGNHVGGFKMVSEEIYNASQGEFDIRPNPNEKDVIMVRKLKQMYMDEARGFVVLLQFFGKDGKMAFWFNDKKRALEFASDCTYNLNSVIDTKGEIDPDEEPYGVRVLELNPDWGKTPEAKEAVLFVKRHCRDMTRVNGKVLFSKELNRISSIFEKQLNVLLNMGCIREITDEGDLYEGFDGPEDMENLAYLCEMITSRVKPDKPKTDDFPIETKEDLDNLVQSIKRSLFKKGYRRVGDWIEIA